MIGPSGRQGPAATLRQHCTQMTQRPGTVNTLFYKVATAESKFKIDKRWLDLVSFMHK